MSEPVNKWEERADMVLGVAASAIVFLMRVLTSIDGVARDVCNFPLRGPFEITELGLLVLIFAGLPLVSHADEHVTMDFIDRVLPERVRRGWIRAMHAICAAIMFFLAWQVWIKANRIAGYGDTTDVLRISIGPFVYFMALMIGLTGVVHVFKMFVPGAERANQVTT